MNLTVNFARGDKFVPGYDDLATAIVKSAASDYKRELKKSKSNGKKTQRAKDIERFFLSEWCDLLSHGQGRVIMRRIKKECGWCAPF